MRADGASTSTTPSDPSPHRRALLLCGAATLAAPHAWAAPAADASPAPDGAAPAPNPLTPLTPWQPGRSPTLSATDLLTGQPRTLAEFAGHPLVVNFWATWCGPCRLELPSLNAAVDRLAPRGLRLLAVNHGEMPERVRRFLAEVPIHGQVLLDRSLQQLPAWGAKGLPASFLLDAHGRPRTMALGEVDWLGPTAQAALQDLLA